MQNSLSLTQQLKKMIEDESSKDNSTWQEYEKAMANFDDLIAKGIIKKRSYNLLSIDEGYLSKGSLFSN